MTLFSLKLWFLLTLTNKVYPYLETHLEYNILLFFQMPSVCVVNLIHVPIDNHESYFPHRFLVPGTINNVSRNINNVGNVMGHQWDNASAFLKWMHYSFLFPWKRKKMPSSFHVFKQINKYLPQIHSFFILIPVPLYYEDNAHEILHQTS